MQEIASRNLKIKLGFRGARISELKSMSDEFLSALAQAGTDIMHIGAESGSQRMLDLMRKGCSVQDIIDVNRKLARHSEIKAAYNWIVGLPTETKEDLQRTCSLTLRLIEDNPNAITFIPNRYRPIPGTALFEMALRFGYKPPAHLEEWAEIEAETDFKAPWYTKETLRMIRMMQVASYFLDDKIGKVKTKNSFLYRIARGVMPLYKPIAAFRMRHGFARLLLEHFFFNTIQPILRFAFRLNP